MALSGKTQKMTGARQWLVSAPKIAVRMQALGTLWSAELRSASRLRRVVCEAQRSTPLLDRVALHTFALRLCLRLQITPANPRKRSNPARNIATLA
jgi:hypothetical protein